MRIQQLARQPAGTFQQTPAQAPPLPALIDCHLGQLEGCRILALQRHRTDDIAAEPREQDGTTHDHSEADARRHTRRGAQFLNNTSATPTNTKMAANPVNVVIGSCNSTAPMSSATTGFTNA